VAILSFHFSSEYASNLKFQRVIDISTVKPFEVMEVMSALLLVVFSAKQMLC